MKKMHEHLTDKKVIIDCGEENAMAMSLNLLLLSLVMDEL